MTELTIDGVPIAFPYEPYNQQRFMMMRVISSLNNKQNCLLELPTGSGKTIGLLCSTLAWHKNNALKKIESGPTNEPEQSDTVIDKVKDVEKNLVNPAQSSAQSSQIKIFFGTRTHKQIGQVVRELKRSAYSNTRMSILSGRKQTCLNRYVLKSKDIDQSCQDVCMSKEGCYFKRKDYPLPENSWDIESVKIPLKRNKVCPYFQFKSWMQEADIIFCPYNYILNPFIRKAMEIDLKNNIVILDEAHNIEDICREGASVSINQEDINSLKMELLNILKYEEIERNNSSLVIMLDKIRVLIELLSSKLFFKDEDVLKKIWDPELFIESMKKCDLNLENIESYKSQWNKLQREIKEANEEKETFEKKSELSVPGIRGNYRHMIDSFMMVVTIMMADEQIHKDDFNIVITEGDKFVEQSFEEIASEVWLSSKKRKSVVLKPNFILNIWCMNPGLAFKQISNSCRSIILTSGTLSPMMSFQKELDCTFSSVFGAPHIVSPEQTFLASISHGPSHTEMKAVYSTTNKLPFQDELGRILLKCSEIVPNGILCFLSSFVLMESLLKRWTDTRLIDEIKKHKSIFMEPRNTSEMDDCIKGYYKSVKRGALLLAVFRGKASEGVDFADDAARLVVTVGIPYPSVTDPKVSLKMNYNTMKNQQHKNTDNHCLTGSEWYNIQAFRALNQAIGRCIRHREDWGAMIMIDSRFDGSNPIYHNGLCTWIKKRKNHFKSWNDLYFNLGLFINTHTKIEENRLSDD